MKKKRFTEQKNLFGKPVYKKLEEEYKKEWQDMPECISEDLTPWKTIKVHFKNEKDMKDFSKFLKQTITEKTRSIWYPKAKIDRLMDKLWVDEDGE